MGLFLPPFFPNGRRAGSMMRSREQKPSRRLIVCAISCGGVTSQQTFVRESARRTSISSISVKQRLCNVAWRDHHLREHHVSRDHHLREHHVSRDHHVVLPATFELERQILFLQLQESSDTRDWILQTTHASNGECLQIVEVAVPLLR